MKISFLSDIGLKRANNQDYTRAFYNQQKMPLVLLADGMGGAKAGDVASSTTVETLGADWEKTDFASGAKINQWLLEKIQEVNATIHQQGLTEEYYGMGTTLEAVVVLAGNYLLAHVGDSRAYTFRNQQMIQLTNDHSLVNEMYLAGEISEEQAQNHPQKNIITRSIGMPGEVEIDSFIQSFQAHDYLLLATDGLTNMVDDQTIQDVINSELNLEQKTKKLIDLANENGGQDNITVALIEFEGADLND